MIKRLWSIAAVRAVIMIILSLACMQTVNILRRPSVNSVTEMLLSLPEYSNMTEASLQGEYAALSDLQIKNMRIFVSNDGSAREFAVVKAEPIHINAVITVFQNRVRELLTEFEGNAEELRRIEYFRIISNGDFVTFTVYDTNSTSENAIHDYFSINRP